MKELWDSSDYIRVVIEDLEVEARVGIHSWEKHPERPHRLLVNIEMFAHLKNVGRKTFIDYDVVHDTLKGWSKRPHTPLLETLADEVIALCFENPLVEACRVKIVKPDIFNEAKGAGVEIYRLNPYSKAKRSTRG